MKNKNRVPMSVIYGMFFLCHYSSPPYVRSARLKGWM
jgi:hypothetical protein